MSSNKIEQLHALKNKVEMGGGEKKIAKQHESGKLTARERINLLLDEGSYIEIDAFVEHRCTDFGMEKTKAAGDGVVTGYGTVDGRLTYVYAQDFTVIGGSLGEMHAKKICKVMDLALKMGAPIVGINDSGGARIQEGINALAGFGEIFYRNTISSGVIPQITAIMGPCAGGAVYSPAITDFVFMVDKTSQMFITGPSVIKAVTGEDVSFDELGGSRTHNAKSGVAHFRSANDEECIEKIKELLSYLPSNNIESTPVKECNDDLNRISERLNEIVPESPNKAYDMKEIVKEIADNNEFFEVQEEYAKSIIIGYIKLNGKTVGIIANQPKVLAGSLDVNSSDKAARFIRFCDCFNIPLLTLVDVPGFLPGVEQEHTGIIRHGAKLLFAYAEATVPKLTIVTRKAYGGAYIGMNSKSLGADYAIAWPSAEIAVMGPDGAANIIFRKEIAEADDPITKRKEKIEEYREAFSNPYEAAKMGHIEDVIEPSHTRPVVISIFEMLESKRDSRPAKKHGNIPL
jgi:acetyl-CoA carboxylase carboxyltransferase component